MAINPLAARSSDSNTLSMTDLLRIPVRDRVQAARTSSSFIDMILNALTPIQIAQAFPDYYRQSLPDVSNFITKNIEAKLSAAGRDWDQTRGGEPGTARPGYTGESKTGTKTPAGTPPPTFEEMKAKLLKKGIDIDNIREVVTEKGTLAGNKRIAALKKLSKEELVKAGFERVETEEGKTLIRETATLASQMSDEEVLSKSSGVVASGTGELKGKQKTQKQVYDSFINAGFSDRQAVALTAEVGRENDFNESTMYGSHTDHNNSKVNLGTFSWQGPRRPKLIKYLKEQGVLDKNGKIIPGQESLDAMARYAKLEMETVPEYKATRDKFLNNPNVDAATAAQVLGKNFISWDMTGKYGLPNPGEHAAKRDRYYQELIELNKKFPGIIPENATADQIEEARQKLIQEEEAKRQSDFAETLYNQESPTSSEATVDRTGKTTLPQGDPSDQWGFEPGRNAEGVDPKLVAAMKLASERFPLRVRFFSGTERGGKGEHGAGMAGDVAIYDEAGHPLSSYQDPRTMNAYAMYWQNVYDAAKELHGEEYANKLSWLGGDVRASGDAMPRLGQSYNPNAYGTGDSMDIRYNRKGINYGEAFKVNEGWNPKYDYYTEEDYFGIGAKQGRFTEEDYAQLVGFRLNDKQKAQMLKRAKEMRSKSGYINRLEATGGVGIGERNVAMSMPERNQQEEAAPSRATDEEYAEPVEENPYSGKSVEELRQMTLQQYDLKESILKKSGKMYYEDPDWMKAHTEERKMYEALEEANRREKKAEEPQSESTEEQDAQPASKPSIEELQTTKLDKQSELNSLGEDATLEQKAALKAEVEKLKSEIEQQSSAEPESQEMAQGGFINEKDNLSIVNADGKTIARINQGEMNGGILSEGTGMRVVSNNTRLADDIVERNNIESPAQQAAMQQPDAAPQREKPPVGARNQQTAEDRNWQEMATSGVHHESPSHNRAMRRAKLLGEGFRFNRGAPASIT